MLRNLSDVVSTGLCVGCGLCLSYLNESYVSLENVEKRGIRPRFSEKYFRDYIKDDFGLSICPGVYQSSNKDLSSMEDDILIGKYLEIWEGFAADPDIRKKASSGGIVTALAQYCLERKDYDSVINVKNDESIPWRNKSVFSSNIYELKERTGSRYAPSSPCELIKDCSVEKKYVFVGKPCDCAGARNWIKNQDAKENPIGFIIGFFCAGVPSEYGSKAFIREAGFEPRTISKNVFRSEGWPGSYLLYRDDEQVFETTYTESWNNLQRFRHFRCQLCPDGLSEQSDISTGDAWHRLKSDNSDGKSIIIVRTEKGRTLIREAIKAGYLKCEISSVENVIAGQGLAERKKEIWGRLLALKMLGMTVPKYDNYNLFRCWNLLSLLRKFRSIMGTLKRVFTRKMVFYRTINIKRS